MHQQRPQLRGQLTSTVACETLLTMFSAGFECSQLQQSRTVSPIPQRYRGAIWSWVYQKTEADCSEDQENRAYWLSWSGWPIWLNNRDLAWVIMLFCTMSTEKMQGFSLGQFWHGTIQGLNLPAAWPIACIGLFCNIYGKLDSVFICQADRKIHEPLLQVSAPKICVTLMQLEVLRNYRATAC